MMFASQPSLVRGGIFGVVIASVFLYYGIVPGPQYFWGSNRQIPNFARRFGYLPLGIVLFILAMRDLWKGLQ